MKRIFGIAALLFVLVLNGYSQGGDTVVNVQVKDYRTKKVLQNASIELIGTDGTTKKFTTDQFGRYSIIRSQLRENEAYTLFCSYQGDYLSKIEKFSLSGGFPITPITMMIELDKGAGGCNFYSSFYFDKNKSEVTVENWQLIKELTETMQMNPAIVIEISGHADFREKYPQDLALQRANAIKTFLVNKGVDAERVVAAGYGASAGYKVQFDQGVFKSGDILDKKFIRNLTDPKALEESLRLNGAAQFKVLRSDYTPKK